MSFKYFLQEEVAQENRQKIEAEKRTVHEAKMDFDKHRKKAEDMESKHSSVREQIDQLPEDMEPLKVQQSFVVSLLFQEPKDAAAAGVSSDFQSFFELDCLGVKAFYLTALSDERVSAVCCCSCSCSCSCSLTLKDEQLKLEAELAKQERNLKILENKLKNHENNIQVMKSDLAQGEEELQVTRNENSVII